MDNNKKCKKWLLKHLHGQHRFMADVALHEWSFEDLL